MEEIWDFQVHTIFSALNNGFGSDFDAYAALFFNEAIKRNIAVVGVTDYFMVDGYRQLAAIQRDSKRLGELIGSGNVAAAQAIRLFANVGVTQSRSRGWTACQLSHAFLRRDFC